MKMQPKSAWILFASVGAATALGAAAVTLWNSRRFRALRAVKRTNAILHRVGNTLCKISEATDGCMA